MSSAKWLPYCLGLGVLTYFLLVTQWCSLGCVSIRVLKISVLYKIISFNIWVRYFVWNFKGYLWNSTQNILPILWKMWILFTGENLRALRFKSSKVFLKFPQDLGQHLFKYDGTKPWLEPVLNIFDKLIVNSSQYIVCWNALHVHKLYPQMFSLGPVSLMVNMTLNQHEKYLQLLLFDISYDYC